jgi:hypothetical protein
MYESSIRNVPSDSIHWTGDCATFHDNFALFKASAEVAAFSNAVPNPCHAGWRTISAEVLVISNTFYPFRVDCRKLKARVKVQSKWQFNRFSGFLDGANNILAPIIEGFLPRSKSFKPYGINSERNKNVTDDKNLGGDCPPTGVARIGHGVTECGNFGGGITESKIVMECCPVARSMDGYGRNIADQ